MTTGACARVRWLRGRAGVAIAICVALTVGVELGGCGPHGDGPRMEGDPVAISGKSTREIDLLFLVEDSGSVETQTSTALAIHSLVDEFRGSPFGVPDLHIAVASSSLGVSGFDGVLGCNQTPPGNNDGAFQVPANCPALNAIGNYLRVPASPGMNNFDGDLDVALACLLQLGGGGCGFEQHFKSIERALGRSMTEGDPSNGGFLRPTANLAVVIVASEDDCSVDSGSGLFNPMTQDAASLGPLTSYRCARFGYVCDGAAPPASIHPGEHFTSTGCDSAEDTGPFAGVARLSTVQSFVENIKALKDGRPDRILVAGVAGPPRPLIMRGVTGMVDPRIEPACDDAVTVFSLPAVRIAKAVQAFGQQGVFASACEAELDIGLSHIGQAIDALGVPCVGGPLADASYPTTKCHAIARTGDGAGKREMQIPACPVGSTLPPCWRIDAFDGCPAGRFVVCRDEECNQDTANETTVDVLYCGEAQE